MNAHQSVNSTLFIEGSTKQFVFSYFERALVLLDDNAVNKLLLLLLLLLVTILINLWPSYIKLILFIY